MRSRRRAPQAPLPRHGGRWRRACARAVRFPSPRDMEAGTGRERSVATPAEGERKVRAPRSGSGSRSPSAIVGKRSLEQGGKRRCVRPAGSFQREPDRRRQRARAAATIRRRRGGGGGGGEASSAAGGRASGPGVRNHSRPRRSGARGSRLPVKNVSHQRRPGTGRGAAARSLPFPLPRPGSSPGGGAAAGRAPAASLAAGAARFAASSLPPALLPSPPPWGAAISRPRRRPGWRAAFPAPAAPIYNRRSAPEPLRLPARRSAPPAPGPAPSGPALLCAPVPQGNPPRPGPSGPPSAPDSRSSPLRTPRSLWLPVTASFRFVPSSLLVHLSSSFGSLVSAPSPRPPLLPAVPLCFSPCAVLRFFSCFFAELRVYLFLSLLGLYWPAFLAGSCSLLVSASSVGLCHSPEVLALRSSAPFNFLSVPLMFCFFCLCACSPVSFYAFISSSVVSSLLIALSPMKAASSSQLF